MPPEATCLTYDRFVSYVPDYIVQMSVGDNGCVYRYRTGAGYNAFFHKDTFHACLHMIHQSTVSYTSFAKRESVPASQWFYNIKIKSIIFFS